MATATAKKVKKNIKQDIAGHLRMIGMLLENGSVVDANEQIEELIGRLADDSISVTQEVERMAMANLFE